MIRMEGKTIRPMTFQDQTDGQVMLEYVMLDHTRIEFFSRMYTLDVEPNTVADCPVKHINMFNSPAEGTPCPILKMVPVAMFRDPFRQGHHKIVLCVPEYTDRPGKTVGYNTRAKFSEFLDKIPDVHPWYAFEQEFYVVDANKRPLDWDFYYDKLEWNSVIAKGNFMRLERDLIETHLKACLYAGIKISGMNRESPPSQWEYQVGPLEGVQASDHLVMSRYILQRLAEMNDMYITFENPPVTRDTLARSAMHVNFSTEATRKEEGIQYIYQYVKNMSKQQSSALRYYDVKDGEDMKWFLSGVNYMAHYDTFTCTVGQKEDSSVRIPAQVATAGRGYIEDRRPISNADPYDVCRVLTMTCLFDTCTLDS